MNRGGTVSVSQKTPAKAVVLPSFGQGVVVRLPVIDLIRAFSIMSVLAVHLVTSGILPIDRNGLIPTILSHGDYGVLIFFVISGFLITRVTNRRETNFFKLDVRAFYVRRVARVVPLLVVVLGIGIFMLTTHHSSSVRLINCFHNPAANYGWIFWTSIFTFSFNWLKASAELSAPNYGLHWDVLWSLAVEEQFYLFFPLIILGLRNYHNLKRFLLTIIFLGPILRAMACLTAPESSHCFSFSAFDLIAMGSLLYLSISEHGGYTLTEKHRPFVLVGSTIVLFATYAGFSPQAALDQIFAPSLIGISTCLIIWSGLSFKPLALIPRWILSIGELSYGAYLLHTLIFYMCWHVLRTGSLWLSLPVFLLAVFAVSAASYWFFELPANRKIRAAFKVR